LSLGKLREQPHGIDLGPLVQRLPARLSTPDKRVRIAPKLYVDDLARLAQHHTQAPSGLVMIGRRHLRSNNSWMHNSERLVKGPSRCTIMMHPDDAAHRGLVDGANARVATAAGSITVPVEITDAMMPGVVSVPHGFGHARRGVKLAVAQAAAGASVNDILDPACIDKLTGTSALTGQPVEVSRA
jgi:anaerobic selenocysteine-containing dehydrogenase